MNDFDEVQSVNTYGKKIPGNKILLSSKLFGYVRHCNHLVSITGRVEDGDDSTTVNKLGQFRGTIKHTLSVSSNNSITNMAL